ncbi:MAG: hypothetical protein ACI9LO_002502 [Planctomycetota bacterium]|jgi:hypothetical protein
MKSIRKHYLQALLILCGIGFLLPASSALQNSPLSVVLPQPQSDLKPEEVVKIVVNALANNDLPRQNAGIETTFNFASPENKRNTGPLSKFSQMVRNDRFAVMLDHASSDFSEVVLSGDSAMQLVRITSGKGAHTVFAFRLSRQQDGPFQGMWMTDAVWPIGQ